MPVVNASLTLSFLHQYQLQSQQLAGRRLSSSVSAAIQFLFIDLTCFIVQKMQATLTHVCASKHRVHFQRETVQFGKSILAD